MPRHWLLVSGAVLLVACSSNPKNGDQQTVIAEGSGNTCQEALGQAKIVASDKVVGSFVNSQKSLVSDKYYTESINEYSGVWFVSTRCWRARGFALPGQDQRRGLPR